LGFVDEWQRNAGVVPHRLQIIGRKATARPTGRPQRCDLQAA